MEIKRTSPTKPPRICIYGQHGSGKSTFAADCPAPVFIDIEGGADSLEVDAFEKPRTFQQVCAQVKHLLNNKHEHKTLVIDSLDWLEKYVWADVCGQVGASDIAAIPYGRGYKMAEVRWNDLLSLLQELNNKGMMIVLLAHCQITRFEDPERESYDRYALDLHKSAGALCAEFVDVLGFLGYKIRTEVKDGKFGQASVKAKSTGDRVLYLEERPAFTAKNRYRLPPVIELPEESPWGSFAAALKEARKNPLRKGNLVEVKKSAELAAVSK
jgi:hypothetical protein